jgi:hypothetical protein
MSSPESSTGPALGQPTPPSPEQQQRARIFGVLFAILDDSRYALLGTST